MPSKRTSNKTFEPFVVSLIGGPASGKSSVLKAVRRAFSARDVIIVREAASFLLHHGFPRPDGTNKRLWAFQDAIIARQMRLEAAARARARRTRVPIVVCDRGMLDTAAYLHGGLEEFKERYKLTPEDVYRRYDVVIELATVATVPELYARDQKSSLHLSENIQEALELAQKTSMLWRQHPRHWHVDLKETVEEKCAAVVGRLKTLIAKKRM